MLDAAEGFVPPDPPELPLALAHVTEVGSWMRTSSWRILRWGTSHTAVGKITPQLPTWRATLVATYRPDDKWTATVAARYSGRQYGQIDNFDGNGNTWQGFSPFFVVDTRVRYDIDKHWSASAGVDNLNNDKYWVFHPFPQRTYYAELRYRY